jgi:predicted MFS family arabinose efflux permease
LARTTLFLLFWANFSNFFDRQVIAALAPILKEYWQLSDYQVGLLATAFEVTYALAPLPIAILADRWLRRRIVSLALALWSGAMILTGAAASYATLLLGRAALGLGQASYGPAALAWLSDLFPPSYRSRAVGIHDLALMLGSAAGYALGGLLGVALGWRPVFFLAALPGLLLAAVLWFLREPPKGQSEYEALGLEQLPEAEKPVPFANALSELLRIPTLVVLYAVAVLLNVATAGLIYWLPSFAVRLHGYGEDQAGLIIGVFTVVFGSAGVLAGGFVADRLLRRTAAARLLTISACLGVGCPLALAALFVQDRTLFFALAALAVFLFTFYFPCLAPLVHQVTRPQLRATAMGLGLFVIHILASAPAPAFVGWLSDRSGDLRLGLAGVLLTALVGSLIGLWGARFVERDTRRMLASLEDSPA